MIDTVLNLLFRCSHRRLTRPLSPVSKPGEPHAQTYVVCLDCGKHIAYDTKEMHLGKVIPAGEAAPRKSKFKLAILGALLLGVVWKGKKRTQ